MATFDPEKLEDKYTHYFRELQRTYRNAFEYVNDRYDSELVHAIDHQVLDESEPFYEGDGEFRVELPENPRDRVQGVLVDDETFDATLREYVDRLEAELHRVFWFDATE